MISYSREPDQFIKVKDVEIACFNSTDNDNIDPVTVASFGEEWGKFNSFTNEELEIIGNEYFDIVPKELLQNDKTALDLGCGSGRWTYYASKRFSFVEAIDPSDAVFVAQNLTSILENVRVTKAGVDQIPFKDESFDFVFSLGVLHHIPDTEAAMIKAVKKLKAGGHFLVYLYYALDNRGLLFKLTFHLSNLLRRIISVLPSFIKKLLCDLIAVFIYLPLIAIAMLAKKVNATFWKKIPLSYYVGKSFYVIRNDALDRFGTPLEQRFSKSEIESMMQNSGLINIKFSSKTPYWHAIGEKK